MFSKNSPATTGRLADFTTQRIFLSTPFWKKIAKFRSFLFSEIRGNLAAVLDDMKNYEH